MRTPQAIAADLKALHEKAEAAFVPPDLKRAAALGAEFAESVCATLDAAGILPTEAPPSSTEA
jgi:hypothetical protein